ncbi:MAG: Rrf2 family transcriptional regulator [Alphaproteobacteria bacterium]|nr:Rrf2 family transcriptional regulator [Alphaproteobacteria bacterium]
MFRLSRKSQLALEAVLDIALHSRPDPVQSKEITERQGVPQRYLEQVMQHLVHAGILKGVRGPRGGYRLARERRRITVGEIVRIVSELETNGSTEQESQSELSYRVIRPLVDALEEEMMQRLEGITIEDLCRQAAGAGVSQAGKSWADFTI